MSSIISSLPQECWSVLAGFRNGVYYGAKIRFPHALVMTALFGKGTIMDKIRAIIRATYTHASNLGLFVVLFKIVRFALKYFRQTDDGLNTFLAGAVGGSIMFGANTPLNSQMNMYMLSRVVFGWGRTMTNFQLVEYKPWMFTLFGAACWSCIMYLYYHQDRVLQGSVISSMDFIYGDTDKRAATNLYDIFMNGTA